MKQTGQNPGRLFIPALTSLFIVAMVVPMSAQTTDSASLRTSQLRLGLTGSIYNVRHTFGFRQLDDPISPDVKASDAPGWSVGLEGMLFLDRSWSIALDLRYNILPGHTRMPLIENEYMRLALPLIPEGDSARYLYVDEVHVDYDIKAHFRTLSLSLLAGWRTRIPGSTSAIGVNGGPVLHYITQSTVRTKAELVSPANAFYINPNGLLLSEDRRAVYYTDGDIRQESLVRAGLHIGLFAEFGTPDSGLMITPGIFYEPGLQPVTGFHDNWYIHRLGGSITVSTTL